MPLYWSIHPGGRIEMEESASEAEVMHLVRAMDVKLIQCSRPVHADTWQMLNDLFFPSARR